PEAIIQPAEDFTISINTISGNLYSQYKDNYLAGKYDNDYFVLLSRIGIGDQSEPTTKLNYLEHINNIPTNITDIWAENVAIVDDYRKDDGAQRVYISFHAFCQNLGKDTKLADIKTAGNRILKLTGSIFPTLMPFTAVGQAVVTGVKNIFGKLAEKAGECKKIEFNLYPVIDTEEHIPGEAPLQEGSYIIFFEDTAIDGLYLDPSGVVRSDTSTAIPPYIVVNIKKGKRLAPGTLDVNTASEILSHHQKNYSYLLPGSGSESGDSSEGFLGALEEFGHSHRIVQSIQRYYQLKAKETRTSPEETKLQELTTLIQNHFNDPNWT
ncbi:hypothetical protein IQ266_19075, partial [filamentous cyanobacterium LEGE 11480]